MEAKLFQDRQVQEKNALKEAKKQEQQDEYERVIKEVESFKAEEAKKKMDRISKNKNHLALVQRQMKEEPRMFAKTGVAIVRNTGLPSLPV